LHHVLPIQAMGEVMRGSLAPATFPMSGGAFLLLGTWCLGSFVITWRILAWRR
jgi:hypothetical protein